MGGSGQRGRGNWLPDSASDSDATSSFSALADDTGNADTTYTDSTVAANTGYVYRVSGVNAAGAGEMSGPAEIAFRPAPPKPGSPSNLSARFNANIDRAGFSVTLSWDAPANEGAATGYQILRKEADATGAVAVLVDDTGNADTAYTDTAVTMDKSYIYRVKARNAGGLGAESQQAHVKVEDYHLRTYCPFDTCIQPIYGPNFLDANEVGDRVKANEYVIGVSVNGDSRAYPIERLGLREVVSDTVGGTPIVVTWCPIA